LAWFPPLELIVPRASFAHVLTAATLVAAFAAAAPASLSAQAAPPLAAAPAPGLSRDEIAAFARLQVSISNMRDSAQAQLAMARNKTPVLQQQLRDKLVTEVAEALHRAGVTEADYERKTYLVATDPEIRKQFDGFIAQQTGVPTPGQVVVVASAPQIKVPAGPVGTHIGHVVNGFSDTPNGMGLLPVALAEAKTAAQHAALAARNPTSLDAMKLHAGHIINAIDPTIVTTGPGLGYGLKKAALGVAMHIDLAAKTAGASPNVVMHASHVATSARNTVVRADQVLVLAKQVQASTSAADAALLINQLVSLTSQLTAGADANGDGKIGWQENEGGLQQAQEHVTLMLAGEGIKP
jgi:hypothetical protein